MLLWILGSLSYIVSSHKLPLLRDLFLLSPQLTFLASPTAPFLTIIPAVPRCRSVARHVVPRGETVAALPYDVGTWWVIHWPGETCCRWGAAIFGGEKLATSEGKGPQLLSNWQNLVRCWWHLVGFSMSFFTFPVGTAGRSFYTKMTVDGDFMQWSNIWFIH